MSDQPYYRRARLRFACTGCGACCTGAADHVEVDAREAEAIRRFLGVSPAWYRRRYLIREPDGSRGIRLDDDGRCPFLGRNNRCRIYSVRPRQCRSYPWWPELVNHRHGWEEEAKRCEGMNRGEIVPLAYIERTLSGQRK